MRLFVACAIPEAVKQEVERLAAPLRRELGGSWPRSETLHLTLAFIGEQPESVVPQLSAELQEKLREEHRAAVGLGPAGVFPNERRPRVGWLAVSPAAPLEKIASAVRAALTSSRVAFDPKPFKPHLTLVRFRDGAPSGAAARLLEHFSSFRTEPFVIDHVSLMSSALSSSGATHTELVRVALRAEAEME